MPHFSKRIAPGHEMGNTRHATPNKGLRSRISRLFTRKMIESFWKNVCNTAGTFDTPIKKAPGEGVPGACSRIRFGDCKRILPVQLGRGVNLSMRMVFIRAVDLAEECETILF